MGAHMAVEAEDGNQVDGKRAQLEANPEYMHTGGG